MSATIFVDGEAGTTGLQIAERLAGREDISQIRLGEAERKDPTARRDALRAADIAILCLPDAAAREAVTLIGNAGTRLIDASTAHRINPDWVYGFGEMTEGQDKAIAGARFVANPGCYPTGAIALIRPLRDAGLIDASARLSISAISGYSGGGKALIAEYETGEAPDFFVYGLDQGHKHLPELKKHALLDEAPIFLPSVGRYHQGMVVQVPLHLSELAGKPAPADLHAVLEAHYAEAPEISVQHLADQPARVDPQAVNGTNAMALSVRASEDGTRAVLVAVLDNLGKGASGAAVQNMDLMLGR